MWLGCDKCAHLQICYQVDSDRLERFIRLQIYLHQENTHDKCRVIYLSTVNLAKLRLIFGKKHVKLIFVAKCSQRCQETTISNPLESLGGGPPFCTRKDLRPRAEGYNFKNLYFCNNIHNRYQIKGFLARGIDSKRSHNTKMLTF